MCLNMNAIVFDDLDGDALQLVLLIRGVVLKPLLHQVTQSWNFGDFFFGKFVVVRSFTADSHLLQPAGV